MEGGVKSTLIIRNSRYEQFGAYNCTASNYYGSDSIEITLTPKSKHAWAYITHTHTRTHALASRVYAEDNALHVSCTHYVSHAYATRRACIYKNVKYTATCVACVVYAAAALLISTNFRYRKFHARLGNSVRRGRDRHRDHHFVRRPVLPTFHFAKQQNGEM